MSSIHSRWKKNLTQVWFVCCVSIAVIVLHYTRILSPVEHLALSILSPFQAFAFEQSGTAEGKSAQDLEALSKEELIEQHLILQDIIKNIRVENAHLQTLTEEAQLTAEQLDFLKKKSYNAQTAKVITRSTEGLSLSISINKGSSDGIQIGYPVVTDAGILIGRIESTTDVTSQVQLITSGNALTSGSVQNDKNSPGVIRGSHNLGMHMDFIPENHTVAVGDMVVTSGTDPFIPRGLIIGEIENVSTVPGSVFQQASIRALFSTESTFIVSVIIP